MQAPDAMAAGLQPATRRQRALAGLIDLAVTGLFLGAWWRWRGAGAARQDRPRARGRVGRAALLRVLREGIEEQLGSPGERLVGIRTVDRRTGRRVELWRTIVVALVRLGGQLAGRSLQPEPAQRDPGEEEQTRQEILAIKERFADDPEARDAALMEHYRTHRQPVHVDLARPLASILAVSIVNGRLRRRLAPTILVDRRR